MVRVGEEMKAVFEAAGIGVVHDTTLYDYPSYNDAYNRSVQGVAENLKKYPSIVPDSWGAFSSKAGMSTG